jgi:hypothetical protein
MLKEPNTGKKVNAGSYQSINFHLHPFGGMANTYEISDFSLHATLL